MSWANDPKTFLDPHEVLQVAHAHLTGGVPQHQLAAMYAINPARIAEAVVALRWAAENHMTIYNKERHK